MKLAINGELRARMASANSRELLRLCTSAVHVKVHYTSLGAGKRDIRCALEWLSLVVPSGSIIMRAG